MIPNVFRVLIIFTIAQLFGCGGGSPPEVETPLPIAITPPPSPKVNMDWQPLTINGGLVDTVATLDNGAILASLDGNLFRTSDAGQNWQALGVRGRKIFRNDIGELITDWKYRSTDAGVSWQALDFETVPLFFRPLRNACTATKRLDLSKRFLYPMILATAGLNMRLFLQV